MDERKKYCEKKLQETMLKKEILIKGTEILVCGAKDEGNHVDLEKMSSILKAYQDVYYDLNRDIKYYEDEIKNLTSEFEEV